MPQEIKYIECTPQQDNIERAFEAKVCRQWEIAVVKFREMAGWSIQFFVPSSSKMVETGFNGTLCWYNVDSFEEAKKKIEWLRSKKRRIRRNIRRSHGRVY
jgi:hypothetical protein